MSTGATQPTLSVKEIHPYLLDAWNRRDFAAMKAAAHPDYTFIGSDGKVMTGGPELCVQVASMYAEAFPDGRLEIQRLLADGNISIAEFVARGTHNGPLMGIPPTGKKVEIHVCNLMEVREGKAYREHEYVDMLSVLQQIGMAPTPGS